MCIAATGISWCKVGIGQGMLPKAIHHEYCGGISQFKYFLPPSIHNTIYIKNSLLSAVFLNMYFDPLDLLDLEMGILPEVIEILRSFFYPDHVFEKWLNVTFQILRYVLQMM